MIEDILLEAAQETELVKETDEWTAKGRVVYPPEYWHAWTVVCEAPGEWRAAFAEQNKAEAPLSSVRPAHRRAEG